MNDIIIASTAISTNKFFDIDFIDNGIIITKRHKEVTPILFSELNKIYIKKCKFGIVNKIGLTSISLILTLFLVRYFPVEIVILASILYIPLFVKVNTYKSYQLHLQLYDGTFYSKEFNKKTKQEHIKYVNTIRKEIFDNQIKYNIQILKPIQNIRIEEEFVFSNLSIA